MKIFNLMIFILIPFIIFGQTNNDLSSFRDTMYFDQMSGNYILEFVGNSSVGEFDTLVTMIFEPPTKVDPIINSRVTYYVDSLYYLYQYSITNGSNAVQRLVNFRLYFNEDVDVKNKQTNNWHGGHYYNSSISHHISWWGDGGLGPTWHSDGFAISSVNLPGIGQAGGQGSTSMTSYKYGRPGYLLEKELLRLSVKKAAFVLTPTIIPVIIPEGVTQIEFIDTLVNYSDSSYSFGWIKDEQTRDKYDNYFNTAKTYLEQNNNNAAKSELQKVLTDCNTDSSSVLTSEAYALLYFNTEYLISQIPEVEPGLPVKLEDSQGNLLPVPSGEGGSLQYYNSGWKDLGAAANGEVIFAKRDAGFEGALTAMYYLWNPGHSTYYKGVLDKSEKFIPRR